MSRGLEQRLLYTALMARRIWGIEGIALAVLASACTEAASDADGSEEGGPEQGTMSALPGGASSQNNAGGAAASGCSAPTPTVIAESEKLRSINVTADAVYYVDRLDGTPQRQILDPISTGSVKRYSLASGETTTLWVSEESSIVDLLVAGDSFYVYLTANSGAPAVYRLPLSGAGTPELVGPEEAMSDAAYIRNALMGIVGDELILDGARTIAISLTDGSTRRLLPDDVDVVSVQLASGRLWYATEQGRGGIFSLDLASRAATPVAVYPGGCTNGDILKTGWFHASDTDLACAGSQLIQGFSSSGSGESLSWETPAVNRRPTYYPAHDDEQSLYLASSEYGVRLPRAGGAAEFFTCEPVAVDAIATNSDWLVWGRSTGAGVVSSIQPLHLNPGSYDAIFAVRRAR
jgi:hypothetical protein